MPQRLTQSLLRVYGLAAATALLLATGSGLPAPLAQAAVTFTVTKTADTSDGVCDADCSLREAINAANAAPGTDTIAFNIPTSDPGYMTSTPTWWRIQPTSALPTITDTVVIDGYTQPGASPNTNTVESGLGLNTVLKIELDGSNVVTNAVGFRPDGNSTVRGIAINRFEVGIKMGDPGNVIAGNFIGTHIAGSAALGNRFGVHISSGPGNTIGGGTAEARNLISGNSNVGVLIEGSPSIGNVVLGNFIGTDATGTIAIPNAFSGVVVSGASNNTIGGTVGGARNIISGNTANGISINGNAATGNMVLGNFIGTDVTGTVDLGNAAQGVSIDNAPNTTIGGATLSARNVISGNDGNGINIFGGDATGTSILGNLIGTDVTGTVDLGNGAQGVGIGYAPNTTIGGVTLSARNLISGNDGNGVHILGSGATGNLVQGNFIGTDLTGTAPLGNFANGVGIVDASGNTIGGAVSGTRNVISGNSKNGIFITGNGATDNLVRGNYIGTDVTGVADLGNVVDGIVLNGAPFNSIGGAAAGAGNVISGNTQGVVIVGSGAVGNHLEGNFIGTDFTGTAPLGNSFPGVVINGGSNNNIGGTASGAGNTIAFNGGDGVFAESGTGNAILGNSIFSNGGLGIDLGPDGVAPNDVGDADTGPNNLQNFPVLTAAYSGGGITTVQGSLTSTPSTAFRLEFFANVACDPSGYGEGKTFLGFANVTTNSIGNEGFNVSFPVNVPVGHLMTSTATDPNGNTSEFSVCQPVAAAPVPTPTPTPLPGVSGLGLAVMALLLAASSWAVRRQRRKTTAASGR